MQKKQFCTFTSAIARTPPLSIANGITTQKKETVDAQLARVQHHQYLNALKNLGITVSLLEPEESLPDSHFVEDAAVIYKNNIILTRPGAPERRNEVELLKKNLPKNLNLIELTNTHATLDGGDVLFMGDHVFIGISLRTNFSGAETLATILKDLNPNLTTHYIEFSGMLHLKSGLVALNDELLLGSPQLKLKNPFPIGKIIWLPEEEGYAANVLVANGSAFVFPECKKAQEILQQANLKPIPLELSEFRKMDGSFTCLSLLH